MLTACIMRRGTTRDGCHGPRYAGRMKQQQVSVAHHHRPVARYDWSEHAERQHARTSRSVGGYDHGTPLGGAGLRSSSAQ